ncbi:MAG: hypothetical protein ACJ75J_09510, partial [Cytophagaceae bacterium]
NMELSYRHFRDMNAMVLRDRENQLSCIYLFDDQWKNIYKNDGLKGMAEVFAVKQDIILLNLKNNTVEIGNIKLNKSDKPE